MFDPVSKAAHYNFSGIECLDAIEASMTKEEFLGFLKGNVMKYLWRYRDKGGRQDLEKAIYYLGKMPNIFDPPNVFVPLNPFALNGGRYQQAEAATTELEPSLSKGAVVVVPDVMVTAPAVPALDTTKVFPSPTARHPNCRNRLQAEGKAHPKSGCAVCGGVFFKCKDSEFA